MKILVATTNKGKLAEFREILKSFEILSLADFKEVPAPAEVLETFEGNALIKARFYFKEFGIPVIVEDSGFCVDALDGKPGVHSSEFFASKGVSGIYDLLTGASLLPRMGALKTKAHFVSVVVFKSGSVEVMATGQTEGEVAAQPRGNGGFGFDPCFIPEGQTRTFAQMTIAEKSAISHRKKAITALKEKLAILNLDGKHL